MEPPARFGCVTRYTERSPGRRAWTLLLGVCLVAWVGFWIAVGRDTWVFPTIMVGMLGGIAALTMGSTGRYGNITLTEEVLRVGRDQVALAALDPDGVSAPGERAQGKLLGGAYAPTLGRGVVGVRLRDGNTRLVATTSPDAFRAALLEALAPQRTR